MNLGIEIVDITEAFKDGTVLLKVCVARTQIHRSMPDNNNISIISLYLLQILDTIAPGAVDPKWLKVEPKGRYAV